MAIYSLQHRTIGRSTHEPGTASAHIRYITRPSAHFRTLSAGIPQNRFAAQRWFDEHEASLRKNGRVCDKFIIALPIELNDEQALDLLRDFGAKLGKGRAPYFVTLHDMDSHNPHAHFVFVDRDPETGKSVAKLSASPRDRKAQGLTPNATEYVRELWENVANEHLARAGFDVTIDRRTLKEQGIDREPEKHRGYDNDNEMPEPEIKTSDKPFSEFTSQEKAEYLRDAIDGYMTASHVWDEYKRLDIKLALDTEAYNRQLEEANKAREAHYASQSRYTEDLKALREHMDEKGKLKGWETPNWLKKIGIDYQSPERKIARAVENKAILSKEAAEHDNEVYLKAKGNVLEAEEIASGTAAELHRHKEIIQAYGDEDDFQERKDEFKYAADYAIEHMTEEELELAREELEVDIEAYQERANPEIQSYEY